YASSELTSRDDAASSDLAKWHLRQAAICVDLRQWRGALLHLNRRLKLVADTDETARMRGRCLLRMEKWQEAVTAFGAAYASLSPSPAILIWKQLALLRMNETERAARDYEAYVAEATKRFVPLDRWWDRRRLESPFQEQETWRDLCVDSVAHRQAGDSWQ